ncbi:hypothetical protein H7E67_15385 [Clostridium gasigenes]|uniref:hypothetical protein n=1 Tax=Clostridium gasigenes TaxID=94869 RepID=UPI001626944E|nr:hypothetical protein [Clostridium gasigenes]MBB6624822.1 hypothetical protein [Clostridium gasigenes]
MELIINDIEKSILKINDMLIYEYKNEMIETKNSLYIYRGIKIINLFSSIITILKCDRYITIESFGVKFFELTEGYIKVLEYITLNNESEKIEMKLYKQVCNIIEIYCN